jgi:Flp pilus assembly protein TadD
MIPLAAIALLLAEPAAGLGDAVQALQAGRLEQARLILDASVKAGVKGPEIDRLLAELAFRTGNWAAALDRYERLAAVHPEEGLNLERTGISAFHLGNLQRAAAALSAATAMPDASWRAWNARGAVADYKRDWAEADLAYDRALQLAPTSAIVLNNRGWSLLLRGDWAEALPLLERSAALAPGTRRISDNLELARAALADDLPKRRASESDSDWAARLNDAGVLAMASGDRKRAIAAFVQAIEARTKWFDRAANNLAIAER